MESVLKSGKILNILDGLKYGTNIGCCYRNSYCFFDNDIHTILVKPDVDVVIKENKNFDSYIINKFRKYRYNYLFKIITYLFYFLFGRYAKIFNEYGYKNKFIKEVKRFSQHKQNKIKNYNFSYNIIWEELYDLLIKYEYKIIIVELLDSDKKINLYDFKVEKDQKYAIIFGSEKIGISDKILTNIDNMTQIYIKTKLSVSLNVNVVNGIVLSYFYNNI